MELTVQLESTNTMTYTLAIAISSAAAYITFVLALVIYCKCKRSRKSQPEISHLPLMTPTTTNTPCDTIQPPYVAGPLHPAVVREYCTPPESSVLLPGPRESPRHPPPSLASTENHKNHSNYPQQYSQPSQRGGSQRSGSHLYETAAHVPRGSRNGDPRNSPATSSAYSSAVLSHPDQGGAALQRQLFTNFQV